MSALARHRPFNWFTLGPSSLSCLDELMGLGANGCRLTFSFGTPELQAERADLVHRAADRAGRSCLAIADLPGGKYRLGEFSGVDAITTGPDEQFRFQLDDLADPRTGVLPVRDEGFFDQARPGDLVVVGDGGAELRVEEVATSSVNARTIGRGWIQHTRGLTIQSERFAPTALPDSDLEFLSFVAEDGRFDAVAISFVASGADIEAARARLAAHGSSLPVISKVESAKGLRAAREITEASDAVMVARGDLALALPWEELPAATRTIATASREAGVPWLVATQVAEGLERFTMPTRAEICDLAHWLDEGAAGAMLSFETVFGANPVMAVAAVSRLLERWYQKV